MPDLQHRENFCMTELAAVIHVWLGPIPSFFWQQYFDSFLGETTFSLPFSVLHTWVGLTSSPSSQGEERVAWAWPIRAFHSLGHSDWFRDGHVTWVGPNNESWEFFFPNYWTMRPFFLLELLGWLALSLELLLTSLAKWGDERCWEDLLRLKSTSKNTVTRWRETLSW